MESAIEMLCGLDVYAANVAEIIAEIDATRANTEENELRNAFLDSITRAIEGMRTTQSVPRAIDDDCEIILPARKRPRVCAAAAAAEAPEPHCDCREPHMKEFGYVASDARVTRRRALEQCVAKYEYKATAASLRMTKQLSLHLARDDIENMEDDLAWLARIYKK